MIGWIFFLVIGATGPAGALEGLRTDVTVDLSDSWAPRMLSEDPGLGEAGRQPYRNEFIRLANHPAGPDERFLELYGIPPSFAVVGARLIDDQRHRCHAAVAGEPDVARWAEAHFRCDGLGADGLRLYQRQHAIIGGGALDAETREALATDSRELDFRALLRVLRERVVDATGVIEDGSALGRRGTVLGRRLDCREMTSTDQLPALPGAAPDLISPLTEEVARALGWNDPDSAAAFFRRGGAEATRDWRVRLSLPAPPSYHSQDMLLAAEIVMGGRRPELRLIARPEHGPDVVLVRWPTTKGGWQREKTDDTTVTMKFKRSAIGEFLWRDMITAPAWFPPETTPDEELIRQTPGGEVRLDREAIGPGYRSAYGLVMLVHHRMPMVWLSEESPELVDAQIRTHGTASYRSVTRGASHGCHRLYSAYATRLAGFLLAHRPFVRHGQIVAHYRRAVVWQGRRLPLRADNRGYLYELTPPVPVRVR